MGRKLVITSCVVGGLVVLYTAGGFWGVPAGINWALTKYADPFLNRKVTTEKIEFNPYTLHLQVHGFNIQKEGAEHPLLHLNGLDTKVDWNSLFKLSPIIEYLSLDGLQAYIIRTGLSEFNFSDIIKKVQEMPAEEKEKKSEEAQKFSVKEIRLSNSEITLDDKFRGKIDKVTDLNFDLPLISNFQDEVDHPITPKLSFNFDGKPFNIDASSVPFTVAQKTGVDFVIKDFNLKNAASFNPVKLNAAVEDGSLDAKLNLAYASEDKDQPKYLRLKGNITISNLAIDDTMNTPYRILGVKQIDINLKQFAYFKQIVDIGEVKITEPQIAVSRNANSINLTNLADHLVKGPEKQEVVPTETQPQKETTRTDETPADKAETGAPWEWNVEKITIANGNVDFKDNTNGFHKQISSIQSTVGPLNGKKGTSTQFSLGLNVIGGSVSTNGTLTLDPVNVNLTAQTQGLSIPEVAPYIAPFTNARVNSGSFSNEGTISLAIGSGEPSFAYKGSADLKSISVSGPTGPVASFADLSVQGVDVKNMPALSIDIASVSLANPVVNVVKSKDGVINLTTLAKSAGSSSAPSESAKTGTETSGASGLPAITIGQANIQQGSVRYTDNVTVPAFHADLSKLVASLSNFTTTQNAPANVKLNGLLNGTPISANGSINPFASSLTLKMNGSIQALSLPAFSPFSVEFTGYPIKQGQLNFTGSYDIAKEQLTSENAFVINKLEFGPESPNAKETLPVGLAVALLQDRNGKIDLNIPVTGSLNDPEFSVGGIIVQVIFNLVTKAITAPFALIGSMFGGEDLDLSHLQFAAGSFEIDQKTLEALGVLSKAMNERPGIKIQLLGIANDKYDGESLKEELLEKKIRYVIFKEAAANNKNKKLTATQVTQAINTLFAEADVKNKPKLETEKSKKEFLLKIQPIPTKDLLELANKRAIAIRNYLIQKEKIAADRLFIVNPEAGADTSFEAGVKLDLQS